MNPNVKNIVNVVYHSAVLSGQTVGYAMLAKKMFRFDVGDPSKANLKEALKLTGAVSLAVITKDYHGKSKILPPDINS
jgi:hypothetical protein